VDKKPTKAETQRNVRCAIAIILAAVAVVTAMVLGSMNLGPHDQFINMGGLAGHIRGPAVVWKYQRADWQIPVAIVIGMLAIGAAGALLARGRRSRIEIAPS
jgi:ABC-type uncharacterized transport system permease subunit